MFFVTNNGCWDDDGRGTEHDEGQSYYVLGVLVWSKVDNGFSSCSCYLVKGVENAVKTTFCSRRPDTANTSVKNFQYRTLRPLFPEQNTAETMK